MLWLCLRLFSYLRQAPLYGPADYGSSCRWRLFSKDLDPTAASHFILPSVAGRQRPTARTGT